MNDTVVYKAQGYQRALAAATALIHRGVWFQMEELPGEEWHITVKNDGDYLHRILQNLKWSRLESAGGVS